MSQEILIVAADLLDQGQVAPAERIARAILKEDGQNAHATALLAKVAVVYGRMDQAEFLYKVAAEALPEHPHVWLEYTEVLRGRGEAAKALEAAETLAERLPDSEAAVASHAAQLFQVGRCEEAMELLQPYADGEAPNNAMVSLLGHFKKTAGDVEGAIVDWLSCIERDPGFGQAWFYLSNLKTYQFSDDQLELLTDQAAREDLPTVCRMELHSAMGKALSDRGDVDGAFAAWDTANTTRRLLIPHDREAFRQALTRDQERYTPELLQRRTGLQDGPTPIFVVGLPRAGSTLVEQILASHSQVEGMGELPKLVMIAESLHGKDLAQLPPSKLMALGEDYLRAAAEVRTTDRPFFVDKHPNNFRHIGLIHMILPQAVIIDARRAPMDCCFGAWRQFFTAGQPFTSDLEDLADYYGLYVEVMNRWDELLPGKVLRVDHEAVLDDLEGQVRAMLKHARLRFQKATLEFHKTDRLVRTPSSVQVRQGLNRSGQDQWRPFAHHLDPLRKGLEKHGLLG